MASTTPLPGPAGHSGVPEVSSGIPSPPQSPPLAAYTVGQELSARRSKARRGGAAYTIREECERFFCDMLKAAFFGLEGKLPRKTSLVMGAHHYSSPEKSYDSTGGEVRDWIELWDYAGDLRFRGFVAGEHEQAALFIFFDETVLGKDLKQGLMAMIELASHPSFNCSQLVACIDRTLPSEDLKCLMKDLGWIGFELTTLEPWGNQTIAVSPKWLFLSMDV